MGRPTGNQLSWGFLLEGRTVEVLSPCTMTVSGFPVPLDHRYGRTSPHATQRSACVHVKAVPLEGMSDPSRIEWGDESIMIDSIDSRFTAPLGRSPKTRPSRGIIIMRLIIIQLLEALSLIHI